MRTFQGYPSFQQLTDAVVDLAATVHKLEFNTAYQLALLTMDPCPPMSGGHILMERWEKTLHEKTKAALQALRTDPISVDA